MVLNKRSVEMNNGRLPGWFRMKFPGGEEYARTKNIVERHHLHTICTSGKCPNIGDCWARGTATFMILGDICTRSCKFCGVKTGKPLPPDPEEPSRLAESIRLMNLKHCVITSVDRDDLADGGASHWANTIKEIKSVNPNTTIESLIPDFDGNTSLIDQILDAGPEVISHNLETVKRLTPAIRSRARYETSLEVLQYISDHDFITKSGIMLGLGEEKNEVLETMDDLIAVGCTVFTLGQYLQPSSKHIPVKQYVEPHLFDEYQKIGLSMGFHHVESSPLVRSSYQAEKHIHVVKNIME